jgi:hypothetical protein
LRDGTATPLQFFFRFKQKNNKNIIMLLPPIYLLTEQRALGVQRVHSCVNKFECLHKKK